MRTLCETDPDPEFRVGKAAGLRFSVRSGPVGRTGKTGVCVIQMRMKKLFTLAIAVLVMAGVTAKAADAKELYEKECAKCHGKDGKGETKMGQKLGAKDYTNPKVQEEMKDADALKAIKEGLKDKAGKVLMKPTEGVTDDDAKALVAYMKKFKK